MQARYTIPLHNQNTREWQGLPAGNEAANVRDGGK